VKDFLFVESDIWLGSSRHLRFTSAVPQIRAFGLSQVCKGHLSYFAFNLGHDSLILSLSGSLYAWRFRPPSSSGNNTIDFPPSRPVSGVISTRFCIHSPRSSDGSHTPQPRSWKMLVLGHLVAREAWPPLTGKRLAPLSGVCGITQLLEAFLSWLPPHFGREPYAQPLSFRARTLYREMRSA